MIQIYPLAVDDMRSMSAFAKRIDVQMERCFVRGGDETSSLRSFIPTDEWGHKDLPEYLPWMGPRYHFTGYPVPTSIFRGEGLVLFTLMRMLRPFFAIECFTGTGYASAWMAAGDPLASVVTVDHYQEGGIGKEGHIRAKQLLGDLELTNVMPLYGTAEILSTELDGRRPSFYFSDGPRVDQIELAPNSVVVRHDNLDGQDKKRSFGIRGGSNLTVMAPSAEDRDQLMNAVARYFPVERCDG